MESFVKSPNRSTAREGSIYIYEPDSRKNFTKHVLFFLQEGEFKFSNEDDNPKLMIFLKVENTLNEKCRFLSMRYPNILERWGVLYFNRYYLLLDEPHEEIPENLNFSNEKYQFYRLIENYLGGRIDEESFKTDFLNKYKITIEKGENFKHCFKSLVNRVLEIELFNLKDILVKIKTLSLNQSSYPEKNSELYEFLEEIYPTLKN